MSKKEKLLVEIGKAKRIIIDKKAELAKLEKNKIKNAVAIIKINVLIAKKEKNLKSLTKAYFKAEN